MPSAVSAAAESGEPARGHPLRSQRQTSCGESLWQPGRMRSGRAISPIIPTRQGWLYVAVLMDLYSRRIIGWAMGDQMTTTLTLRALEMALQQRPIPVGLLHHSDRGCQYVAMPYQQRLVALGIRCSMSRPGNCWDNAVVERCFATLKTELFHA